MSVKEELEALKPQHDLTITTERLFLRPVGATPDIHFIHAMRRNAANMVHMTTGVETSTDPYSCHSAERIRLMTSPKGFAFAVQLRAATASPGEQASAPVIGYIGIFRPPACAYLFDEPHWGRGYATEALKAFFDVYWKHFPAGLPGARPEDVNIVMAHVYKGNVGSEKVLQKVGFRPIRTEDFSTEDKGVVSETVFLLERPQKVPVPEDVAGGIS